MRVRWGFLIGVTSSLGIHAGFVLVVPPPGADAVRQEEFHVVELRRLEFPLPDLPPLPKKLSAEKTDIGRPTLLTSPEKSEPPAAGLSLEEMARSARVPQLEASLPPPSTVFLPDKPEEMSVVPPERIGRSDRPRGTPEGTRLGGKLRVRSPPVRLRLGSSDKLKALRSRLIQEEIRRTAKAKPTSGEIRGPAASRQLVFRPPPPDIPKGAEGEIELKFWVLSDGTVGRIVLLRRGNLALETAAIQNLKQWKFNSLPPGADVPGQWGTLRFRFLSAAAKARPSLE